MRIELICSIRRSATGERRFIGLSLNYQDTLLFLGHVVLSSQLQDDPSYLSDRFNKFRVPELQNGTSLP